jgi:hypothetical protein
MNIPRPYLGGLMLVLVWAIFTVNMFALNRYWYWIYPWFDMPMHLLGGFWLGGTTVWLLSGHRARMRMPTLSFGIVIGVAMTIGLLWELFEFSIDTFIMFRLNDIPDTLSDLSMDFLGASAAYILFAPRRVSSRIDIIENATEGDTTESISRE